MPRDINGNYTLPSSYNPVVTGTTIQSEWANTTLDDVAAAMTDSLSRSGQGGMLGTFKMFDGTVPIPGLAFTNESTTGASRPTAGSFAISVLGSERGRFTTTGATVTGTFTTTGTVGIGGATSPAQLNITGTQLSSGIQLNNGATNIAVLGNVSTVLGTGTDNTVALAAQNSLPLTLMTGAVSRLTIAPTGGISMFGNAAVGGSPGAERFAIFTPNGTGATLRLSQGSQRDWYLYIPPSQPDLRIADATLGLDRVTLDTSGNLGVGTVTPSLYGRLGLVADGFDFFANPGEGGTTTAVGTRGNVSFTFYTNNAARAAITPSGVFTYAGIEIGFRGIPITTVGLDPGKCFYTASGFTLTTGWPDGTAFTVINNSGSPFTITQGAGMTLRLAGTASTGNRTLAARGMATIIITTSSEGYISGAGVS